MKFRQRMVFVFLFIATIIFLLIYQISVEERAIEYVSDTSLRELNQTDVGELHSEKRLIKRESERNIEMRQEYVAIEHEKDSFRNLENQSHLCSFIFDREAVEFARTKIYSLKSEEGHGFLFYIHLDMPSIHELTKYISSETLRYQTENDILEWQFVLKQERFLVQLPVDFDLVTFELLKLDKEESDITIPIQVNDSNCKITDDNKHATIDSIHALLWNKVLANYTDFILCNRYFEPNVRRKNIYYFTTIWIGYDLNCTRYIDQIKKFEEKKDELPVITPLLCFFLAQQFVWMFILVENIVKEKVVFSCVSTQDEDTISTTDKEMTTRQNTEMKEDDAQTSVKEPVENKAQRECDPSRNDCTKKDISYGYRKGDHPYGLHRILLKYFEPKWSEFECKYSEICSCILDLLSKYCYNTPAFRLMFILWIFILFPLGLYRTLYRKSMTDKIYKEFRHVVRTSEPLFYIIENEQTAVILDIVYATVFPFICIFICTWLYNTYVSDIKRDNRISYGISNRLIRHVSSIMSLCKYLSGIYIPFVQLAIFPLILVVNTCCRRKKYSKYKHPYTKNCIRFFQVWQCRCKKSECLCSTFRCKNFCLKKCISNFKDCDCKLLCSVCKSIRANCNKAAFTMIFLKTYRKLCHVLRKHFELIWHIINCIFPILSLIRHSFTCLRVITSLPNLLQEIVFAIYGAVCYAFLRPMITTFTFVLRSITYIVFVVLPIRSHLYQYVLIIMAAFIYFLKYYVEIVKMFTDILSCVFDIKVECKGKPDSRKPDDAGGNSSSENLTTEEDLFELKFKKGKLESKNYYDKRCNSSLENISVDFDLKIEKGKSESENYNDDDKSGNSSSKNLTFDFDLKVKKGKSKNENHEEKGDQSSENLIVEEYLLTYILEQLPFVRKRIYYFILKCVVVVMYLIITIETLLLSGRARSQNSFKDVFQLALILVGPYAFSQVWKSDGSYITEENRREIKNAYESYPHESKDANNPGPIDPSEFENFKNYSSCCPCFTRKQSTEETNSHKKLERNAKESNTYKPKKNYHSININKSPEV